MKRIATLVAVIIVSLPLAGASSVTLAQSDAVPSIDEDEITPGERFGGAVGVQHAEFEGTIAEHRFTVVLGNATTNETMARELVIHMESFDERLTEIEDSRTDLEDQREASEISHGHFVANLARLEAERTTITHLAERAEDLSRDLPEEVLDEQGLDIEQISALRERAEDLAVEEVATIAREIAGGNTSMVVDVGEDHSVTFPSEANMSATSIGDVPDDVNVSTDHLKGAMGF